MVFNAASGDAAFLTEVCLLLVVLLVLAGASCTIDHLLSFAATGNHIWLMILGVVAVDAILLWFWKPWNLQSAVVACRCQRGGD